MWSMFDEGWEFVMCSSEVWGEVNIVFGIDLVVAREVVVCMMYFYMVVVI